VIDTLESYSLEVTGQRAFLTPRTFFKKAKKIEIEVGCGKGFFLAETASCNSSRYYLGIESAHSFARLAENRVRRRGIQNVRVVDWSAETLLPFFKKNTVDRFHIYFPDPWPKKRHSKRRLWKEDFLNELERLLIPKGKIYFATDHLEYFDLAIQLLRSTESPFVLERKENYRFFDGASAPTSYEKKFAKEGRSMRYASFIKKGARAKF